MKYIFIFIFSFLQYFSFAQDEIVATNAVMDDAQFWKIIDKSKDDNVADQKESIIKSLRKLTEREIIMFNNKFYTLLDIAFENKVLTAFNIINTECNEECFLDARAWLVAQGKQVYMNAVANPESLSKLEKIKIEGFDELKFAADDLYYKLYKEHIPFGLKMRSEPGGAIFNSNKDELKKYFPKLADKYFLD